MMSPSATYAAAHTRAAKPALPAMLVTVASGVAPYGCYTAFSEKPLDARALGTGAFRRLRGADRRDLRQQRQRSDDSASSVMARNVRVGDLVVIEPSGLLGTVRYTGPTKFAKGRWIGVQLKTAGKSARCEIAAQRRRRQRRGPRRCGRGLAARPRSFVAHALRARTLYCVPTRGRPPPPRRVCVR
jgi:hypothetical protein